MKETVTVKGKPVIEIYESIEGSYCFVTEKAYKQDSLIDGKVCKDNQILFGYLRLASCPQGLSVLKKCRGGEPKPSEAGQRDVEEPQPCYRPPPRSEER